MNKHKQMTRLALSAAIAAILVSGAAAAQDTASTGTSAAPRTKAEQAADAKNTKNMQQVVVTGSATGVKKIDASYSITTASAEQIRDANPISTADLLKIAPGLWPESTGGQTGANIEIAGFPGGGDAPFNTVQLMGSPLYGMPTLSFFEQTSIFRLDDTIQRGLPDSVAGQAAGQQRLALDRLQRAVAGIQQQSVGAADVANGALLDPPGGAGRCSEIAGLGFVNK